MPNSILLAGKILDNTAVPTKRTPVMIFQMPISRKYAGKSASEICSKERLV